MLSFKEFLKEKTKDTKFHLCGFFTSNNTNAVTFFIADLNFNVIKQCPAFLGNSYTKETLELRAEYNIQDNTVIYYCQDIEDLKDKVTTEYNLYVSSFRFTFPKILQVQQKEETDSIEKYYLDRTCYATPEQYNVYSSFSSFEKGDPSIAYIRLRFGTVYCKVPSPEGIIIYSYNFEDDGWKGIFSTEEEREFFLNKIKHSIYNHYNQLKS